MLVQVAILGPFPSPGFQSSGPGALGSAGKKLVVSTGAVHSIARAWPAVKSLALEPGGQDFKSQPCPVSIPAAFSISLSLFPHMRNGDNVSLGGFF